MNLTMTVFLAAGAALLLFAVKKTNPGAVFLSAATGVAALFAADLALGEFLAVVHDPADGLVG